MKKLFILFLFVQSMASASAQVACDSIYPVCDSMSIDSIYVSHNQFGDRLQVLLHSQHAQVYAPNFVVCPDNPAVQFDNNTKWLFGIGGPTVNPINLYYQFQNFDTTLQSISGKMIAGFGAIQAQVCEMTFTIPLDGGTPNGTTEISEAEGVRILLHPVSQVLTVESLNAANRWVNIQLFDAAGRMQKAATNKNPIDLSGYPAGLYIVRVALEDHRLVTKKVLVR